MFPRNILILLTIVGSLYQCDLARAQQSRNGSSGFVHQGKFIGYVPAHLRYGAQSSEPRALPESRAFARPNNTEFAGFVTESDQPQEALAYESEVQFESEAVHSPKSLSDESIWGPDTSCYLMPCIWGRADSLYWWSKEMNVPPLGTTSPIGTPQAQAGVLGQPGTTIVLGNGPVHDEVHLGGRFTLGLWLDPSQCSGLDVTYIKLHDDAESFSASNNDFAILARPFFNLGNGTEDARRIAFAGEVQGTLSIQTTSELQSLDAAYRWTSMQTRCQRTAVLLGYRFAQLEERVRIDESTLALAGPLAGATFDLFDQFTTKNTFHGAMAGVEIEWQKNRYWSWEALAKVAVGQNNTRADVAGQVTTTIAGVSATAQGGLLALPTNISTFEESEMGALWEFGLTLRRQVRRELTATFGYTFLLWTGVARAGEQIDLGINTTQVPPGVLVGDARPAFAFDMSSYWAQGLQIGLEYAY